MDQTDEYRARNSNRCAVDVKNRRRVHKFCEISRTAWVYKDGNIGSYVIRVVVEWDQASMCEIKQEGRSIALRACLGFVRMASDLREMFSYG